MDSSQTPTKSTQSPFVEAVSHMINDASESCRMLNTRKPDLEKLKRLDNKGIELKKIPYLKYGYYSDSDFSMGATPEYLLGLYYLQGPASQTVAEILNPKEYLKIYIQQYLSLLHNL